MNALLDQLRSLRRRVKRLSVMHGIGRVLAATVLLLVVVVLLDYLLNLPPSMRIVLIAVALIAWAWLLIRWIILPILARLSLDEIAARMERAFPLFKDRLRSAVNFLSTAPHDSPAMRQKVLEQTTEMAAQMHLRRAIRSAPAWKSLGTAALSISVLLGLGAWVHRVRPGYLDIALSRLLTPMNALSWPRNVQIEMLGAAPRLAPAGGQVQFRMRLTRGDSPTRQAVIHYQYGRGAEHMEQMTRGADGIYTASLDVRGAGEPMRTWIEAGDDRTQPESIQVVPPLAIRGVQARVAPPPYTSAAPTTTDLSAAPATAVAGSQVQLTVRFNQPCATNKPPELLISRGREQTSPSTSRAINVQWTYADNKQAVGTFIADQSMRFHIRGADPYGFHNAAIEEYELIVKPDALPTIQIESPQHSQDATADALIPLQAAADDDYGITDVILVIDRLGPEKYHWNLPLVTHAQASTGASLTPLESTSDRRRYRITGDWNLSSMSLTAAPTPNTTLKPGDTIEYYLQARDNFLLPGAPAGDDQVASPEHLGMIAHRPAQSGKLRLTIVTSEEMVNRVLEEFRSLTHRIKSVRDSQQRTGMETADLARRAAHQPKLSDEDRVTLRRLLDQQTSAASESARLADQAKQLGDKLHRNRLDQSSPDLHQMADDVRRLLEQASAHAMTDASQRLNDAAQAPDAGARAGALSQAQQRQSAAENELQQALDRLKDVGTLEQSMDAITRLLRMQRDLAKQLQDVGARNLGKTPGQMSQADQEQLKNLADQQANLARQSDQAIDKMQKTGEQLSKSDPASAAAMKNAADTARQQQVVPSQQQAAQAARQNQQSDAQAAQSQAELGLQMILGNLQEAQKHKLEELARHLADLHRQVLHLARRQAGHNLANLQLQGNEAIKQAGDKLVAALKQEANPQSTDAPRGSTGNKTPDTPAPTLNQLTASQSLTQRNTRDIAQSADSSKGDDVQTIQLLLRAAGDMERAGAALNHQQLAQAYDPSQVQALATLNEALKQIVKRQAELDDKLARGRRETLRGKYEQIRNDQAALNGNVVSIDNASRTDHGQFNRADLIRLHQLAADQHALSARIDKLEDDLTAMNSIVYLWTNQDISRLMNVSRADLDKPATGRPTQLSQQRIVTMLDDVIKSLAIQPRVSEFEQRQSNAGGGQGGGGGGGQSKQLPPETELRLLKALQQMVNTQTQSANAAAKDPQQLKEIGKRQGDLRGLLDTLLSKASDGQVTLGPPPPNKNILPEESASQNDDDLEQQLLHAKRSDDSSTDAIHQLGERMSRSDQRLALDQDPGKVTQTIQQNILKGLDELIEQSRQQMAKNSSSNQQNSSQAQAQNQPSANQKPNSPDNQGTGGPQAQASKGQSGPAQSSTIGQGNGQSGTQLGPDLRQKLSEWGGISPRMRAAVIDSAGETVIQKYQELVEDYYRSLATKEGE